MEKEGMAGMPNFPLQGKYIAMLAPSFVVKFPYPAIVARLKLLGFEKVTELTFGAKMINREYHKQLKKSKQLLIASPCPGIVEIVKTKFPQYAKNLARIDSPVEATAKICKKIYLGYKTVFISPCHYKKKEAFHSKYIDYVIDYIQLEKLFLEHKIPLKPKKREYFDKFYNDYTKIFPLSGGLAKTAHLRGVIREDEIKTVDGLPEVMAFLENPDPKIRFLDVLFCEGGCIGGPCVTSKLNIKQRKRKVLKYLEDSKQEDIPEAKKGLVSKAKGIKFIH